MKKSMILGISLIVLGLTFSLSKYLITKKSKDIEENIIDEFTELLYNKENETSNILESYESLTSEFLGYIEIPSLKIKKLIKEGVSEEILKNSIGLVQNGASLDSNIGNIVLAGHDTENIFKSLYEIKVGEEIFIVTHKKIYKYIVKSTKIISKNDVEILNNYNNKLEVNLITCIDNGENRFVVNAIKGL